MPVDMVQKFQFLIGTLQTRNIYNTVTFRVEVSIPYRYATNLFRPQTCTAEMLVSIPYRYATNRTDQQISADPCWFQFLIGTLQTDGYWGVACWL